MATSGNPQIPQGTLNRIRGNIAVVSNASLNITAPFLGKSGVNLSFGGDTALLLPTMTGVVSSGEPYQICTISAELLKTQTLASYYKTQIENNTFIGDVVFTSDATPLPSYTLTNCSILGVDDISGNGSDAGFRIRIGGAYLINNNLFA